MEARSGFSCNSPKLVLLHNYTVSSIFIYYALYPTFPSKGLEKYVNFMTAMIFQSHTQLPICTEYRAQFLPLNPVLNPSHASCYEKEESTQQLSTVCLHLAVCGSVSDIAKTALNKLLCLILK